MRVRSIVGLDIGTSSIKSIVVLPKPETSEFEVVSQVSEPSFGVRKGVVINVDKVSQLVSAVLEKAEKDSGQEIKEVFVNIGGSHIFSAFSHGTVAVSRADQKISKEDIDRVLQAAQTFSMPPNREILGIFPREFIVDGEKGIREALGMEGVRLEAEILVLGCFSPYLKNLQNSILRADYQIADIVANSLASSRAVLTPRERELGVLLLDIGAGTTGFCVIFEGSVLTTGVIPIGSGHITNDIAVGLKTDIDTAEAIKVQFGSCSLAGAKKIKIKERASEEALSFPQNALGRIIDARVSEIFEQVQKELKKYSLPKLPAGVVLCGGGAKIPKIKEFAKRSFKLPSKISRPIGFFPKIEDPQLACVCGLTLQAREALEEERFFGGGLLQKIKRIVRSFVP